MTLILPEQADPYGNGLTLTPAMHLDAVRHQLDRATHLAEITAVESDLWDAHRTRMRLGHARPWINEALALCKQRREELSATSAQPGPAGSPCSVDLEDM